MKWETVKLQGLCDLITKGTTPSNIGESFTESGINFIRSELITANKYVSTQGLVYISCETHEKLKRSQLKAGDILFSMAGVYLGKTAILREEDIPANTNQAVAIIRIAEGKCNREYVYYFLNLPSTVKQVNALTGQAAQPNINLTQIGNLSIDLPERAVQNQIVSILSAYDDLIENNQKQIKLLEEAAQRLYKEWFIDLHFPGHETTPIVNGIPEGWERKTVEKCLIISIGGGWGKDEPQGTYLHKGRVIRGTDIPDVYYGNYQDVPLRYHTEKGIRTRSLQENDIIFELSNGNIDNIGRCLLIDKEMLRACGGNAICASFCKLLRPINEAYSLLLFLEIQAMQYNGTMLPLKKHGANGINNFDFQGFLQHDILVPNDIELLDSIKAITARISTLREQLRLLTEARDRLLPKLMSGEIEV